MSCKMSAYPVSCIPNSSSHSHTLTHQSMPYKTHRGGIYRYQPICSLICTDNKVVLKKIKKK